MSCNRFENSFCGINTLVILSLLVVIDGEIEVIELLCGENRGDHINEIMI